MLVCSFARLESVLPERVVGPVLVSDISHMRTSVNANGGGNLVFYLCYFVMIVVLKE